MLTGNTPQATRALERAVQAFGAQHCAHLPKGAVAAWSYLMPKRRKVGDRVCRVLTRVEKLEAVCILHQEASPDSLKVRRLLGYCTDIGWRAAAKLNRVHGPPTFYFVEEPEERYDGVFDLDPNENEHFRDDRGFYDEAGVLQPFEPRAHTGWETAYKSRHEAWNEQGDVESQPPAPNRFYPAPAAEPLNRGLESTKAVWRIDHHGVSTLLGLRDHRQSCQRTLQALEVRQSRARALPEAPLYYATPKEVQRNLREGERLFTLRRRMELEADEAEVSAHAERDVPETILELLEQQVEELSRKAPRGLVAALAEERMKAREHAEGNRRYVDGLAALKRAASQYVVA